MQVAAAELLPPTRGDDDLAMKLLNEQSLNKVSQHCGAPICARNGRTPEHLINLVEDHLSFLIGRGVPADIRIRNVHVLKDGSKSIQIWFILS